MRMQPQLERLLSDDVLPSVHPVDPILKELVTRCVDESASLDDARVLINLAFAEVSERVDMVQAVVMNAISQLR